MVWMKTDPAFGQKNSHLCKKKPETNLHDSPASKRIQTYNVLLWNHYTTMTMVAGSGVDDNI